ncbi:hypothetical protein ACHAW5_002708 [Stephanodiscus triporus]|uniref:Uncharacterized protein n=1 Tax=Stephanodiscus triporus TaxID=2934178 RepID=A0ABD3MH80_9STRA
MTFLNGREKVIASTVCKVWLSVSRMRDSWERLDHLNGLSNKSKRVEHDVPPGSFESPAIYQPQVSKASNKYKLGKSSAQSIARACPYPETWDIGYRVGWAGEGLRSRRRYRELREPHVHPHQHRNWHGVMDCGMGLQLLDLRIKNCCMDSELLSGFDARRHLRALSQSQVLCVPRPWYIRRGVT